MWRFFQTSPSKNYQKVIYLTKFWWRFFFEIWQLGISTDKILVAFFFFFEIWHLGILIDRILVASQHLSYMYSSIQSKHSIGRENNLKKQSMKTYKHISPRATEKLSITT